MKRLLSLLLILVLVIPLKAEAASVLKIGDDSYNDISLLKSATYTCSLKAGGLRIHECATGVTSGTIAIYDGKTLISKLNMSVDYLDIHEIKIPKTGTYQIKITSNKPSKDANLYMQLFNSSNAPTTLKANKEYSSYLYGAVKYKVTLSANGLLGVTIKDVIPDSTQDIAITLLNSTGKVLVKKTIKKFNDLRYVEFFYGLPKGTYTIQVEGKSGESVISYSNTAVSDQSGSTQTKATTLGENKSGILYVSDKSTKADWYKVKLSKAGNLNLNFESKSNAGMTVEIRNSSKVLKTIKVKDKSDYSAKLSAGTYYIKITKGKYGSSGTYSIHTN